MCTLYTPFLIPPPCALPIRNLGTTRRVYTFAEKEASSSVSCIPPYPDSERQSRSKECFNAEEVFVKDEVNNFTCLNGSLHGTCWKKNRAKFSPFRRVTDTLNIRSRSPSNFSSPVFGGCSLLFRARGTVFFYSFIQPSRFNIFLKYKLLSEDNRYALSANTFCHRNEMRSCSCLISILSELVFNV